MLAQALGLGYVPVERGLCQVLLERFSSHRSLKVELVLVQPPKTNMEEVEGW